MGVIVLHARVVKYSGNRVCLYPPAEHQEKLRKLHGETIPVIAVLPEEEARRDALEQVLAEILAALDTVADALAKGKPTEERHLHKLQQHIQKARQLLEQGGDMQ